MCAYECVFVNVCVGKLLCAVSTCKEWTLRARTPSFDSSKLPILAQAGPWVYNRERKREQTAKGIKNIMSLRAARRHIFPTEVTVDYLHGIESLWWKRDLGGSPMECKLNVEHANRLPQLP